MNDLMNIENKILVIRDQQVMLDRDLAEIYGYETKNFNRQVKNNIEKFDEDFMFQLTKDESNTISRCKNFTLNEKDGRGSNIKYLPYVFTEQGIYMLMTVLRGELAVQQSKTLIRLFKKMRHYFAENAGIISRISDSETKFNAQYPTLTIKNTTSMHDRFLIIDRTEIYHIGASLKDLGKKCFGFTRLEEAQLMIKTVLSAV